MIEYHLAQINIARMLAPIDDPIMTDFVVQLQRLGGWDSWFCMAATIGRR